MALLDFPANPSNGQKYPASPTPGQNQYEWSSTEQTWRLLGYTSTVAIGTYGDATNVGQFTVDAQGRITFAQNVPILSASPATSTTLGLVKPDNVTTVVAPDGTISAITGGTGTVTAVLSGTGLTGGPITTTGTIALANTSVTPGSYTYGSFTVNAQGRITAANNGLSPVTSVSGTAPIVSTGGLSPTISLSNTAVTPGSYTRANITVDAQGRITAAANGSAGGTGTVTSVATGTGLTGGPITTTGTIALANTAVSPGTYTLATVTVDAQGRITSASNGTAGGTGTVTSVATGTGLTGGPVTTSGTISLANTAVTAGSYTNASLTVDAQGRLTAASSGIAPVTAVTGTAPIVSSGGDTPALSLANTAVTPGTYGDASNVGTFTVDAQGRITAASNVAIPAATIATTTSPGIVKPDGTTITIALDGTITAVAPSNYWSRSGTLISPAATGDQVQISISSSLITPGLSLVGKPTTGFGSLSAASENMFFAVNGTEYLNFSAGGLVVKSATGIGLTVGGLANPLGSQGFIMQPQINGPEFFNIGFSQSSSPAPFNTPTVPFSYYRTTFGTKRSFSFFVSEDFGTGTGYPDLVIGTDGFTKFPKSKGIQFYDIDNTNYVSFQAPNNVTTTAAWVLPPADGTSGQVLSTNGTGAFTWSNPGANYWSRTGTVLSPATVGDQIQVSPGTTAAPGLAFTVDAASGIGFDFARNVGFLAANSFRPLEFGADGIKIQYFTAFGNTPPLQVYGAVNGATMQAAARFQTQVSGAYDGLEIGFWPTDGLGGATTYYSAVAGSVSNNRTLSFFVSNQISAGSSKPDLVIGLDGSINILSQHVLQFWDANNSNYVGFRSPSVVVTNVTWTLPAADGTSGQVLSTNGTGALSWSSVSTVVAAPASSGAAGANGQVASDSNYFYWYAGGGWQRVAKDTAPW